MISVKFHGDKKGLDYINKTKTPTSGETVFVKGKEKTLNQVASPSTTPHYSYCEKSRHTKGNVSLDFLRGTSSI